MPEKEKSIAEINAERVKNKPQNFDQAKRNSKVNGTGQCMRNCGHKYRFPPIEPSMTRKERKRAEEKIEAIKKSHDVTCPKFLLWKKDIQKFKETHPEVDPRQLRMTSAPVCPSPAVQKKVRPKVKKPVNGKVEIDQKVPESNNKEE